MILRDVWYEVQRTKDGEKGRMNAKVAKHVYIYIKSDQSKAKYVEGVAKQEPNVVIQDYKLLEF